MPISSLQERMKQIKPTSPTEVKETLSVTDTDDKLAGRMRNLNLGDQQVEKNLNTTQDLNPDKEAEVYDLSKRSGFTASTVREVPEQVSKVLGYPVFTIKNPENIQRYLGRSLTPGQPNTAISGDDVEGMENVQTTWEKTKQAFEEGDIEQQTNILVYRRELLGFDPDKVNQQIETLNKQRDELKPFEARGFFEKVLTGTARQLPQMISSLQRGVERAPEGAVIGATGAMLLTPEFSPITVPAGFVGGAGLGFKAGQIEGIFSQEFGGAFREFSEITDEQGNKINPTLVKVMAFGVGSVNALFEYASFKAFAKTFPGGQAFLDKMTPDFVRKVATSKTVRDQLKQIAVNAGRSWTTEEATEILQETTNVLFGEMMKQIQTQLTGAEFKDFDFDSFAERIKEIATETAYSALGFIIPGTTASTFKAVADSTISKKFNDDNNNMKAATDETLTQQRSPDHANNFLQNIGAGAPILISPEGINELYLQSTKEEADALLTKVGVDPTNARATAAAGQDIEVVQSKVLTQLSPEEYGKIKNDIKPAPSAYTQRELDAQKDVDDVENTVKLLAEKSEQEKAINVEISRLEGEIEKAKLTDAKLAKDAPILLRGLVERLESFGVDPVQKLKNITIKRIPFRDFVEKGKGLFQAPTDVDFKLSQDIATLSIRINKLDPTDPAGKKLITKLEGQRIELEKQLQERAFIGFETFLQAAPKKGKPRGALVFEGEKRLINLFEGADLSTVLHEVGHVAQLEYTALEESGEASDSLKTDMKTIRDWVGAEEGAPLTRDQSEQFARGFEAYLMEGKAPTNALRTAFERFKHYLTSVYKTAKKLNVTLNKDIRGVFDRMLSANLEVEAAAASGGFTIKTTAEMNELGVTKADQLFAKELISQATLKAERRLTQTRNKNLADLNRKWKEEARREIKNEVPAYGIIDEIIKDGNQMDRDEFINAGQAEISDLPTSRLLKKDGKPIDMVAAFYFEGTPAQEMIDQLAILPPFSEAVNQRVVEKQAEHDAQHQVEDFIVDLPEYRKYLELMGRYITGKGIDQAAIDAGIQRNIKRWETEAINEITAESPDLTGTELQRAIDERVQDKIAAFQEKKAKLGAISTDALKALAVETMAAKTVREARLVNKFLSAMKKANSDERRAILRKDWAAASESNELARFNYEMSSLSVKIREEVDTILKRDKRIGKSKNIEFEHKEAILTLINRYNLASLAPQEPQNVPDYATLFAGDSFGNAGFPVPDFLTGNLGDFREMRIEQLRDLDNAIRYLQGKGQIQKNEFMADGVTRFEDVDNESVAILDTMKVLKKWEKGSMMRRLSDFTRKNFARLDSLTFTAKSVDGYTNLGRDGVKGPIERNVIDTIKSGINDMLSQGKQVQTELKPHLDRIQKTNRKWRKQFGGHIQIEGVPLPAELLADGQTKGWKDYQIWAMVLNTGNIGEKSNLENLMAGYTDLDIAMIEKVKSMLTVEDMRAVQGVWKAMDSLFKQADAQFLKDNNYHMPKVIATPFRFKGRAFEGGYYPIRHDKNLSFKVADRGLIEDFFNNEGAKISVPYTKKNFSVQRVRNVALPIRLNLSVIDEHFRGVLNYIHLSDPIRDADRITRQTGFRTSATKILGEDVYNTIRPALQHIANPRSEGLDLPGGRGVELARGLSTAYILAWNTGVALKQPLSTFGAIRDMGLVPYLKGFGSVLSSPSMNYQQMIELSLFMDNRRSAFDRELKSEFLKLTADQKGIYFGDTKVTWQDVKNFGYWQIRIADMVTVLPIWNGAFNDKLLPDQSNLQEAIDYADDIVRNSQPSAQPLDLSSWQRDGGVFRLFSQFQTFTVGKYWQRQRLWYRAWKQGKVTTGEYAYFNLLDAVVPLIAINLLQAVLWGRDLGDEEERDKIRNNVLVSWATMGVPIIGTIARSISSGFGDSFDSPVIKTANKLVDSFVKGGKNLNVFESKKEREKALWALGNIFSIASGVPVDKIVARAIKGSKQKKGVPVVKYLMPAPKK